MNLFSLPLQIIRNQKEGLKTQKLIEADLKQLITILSPSPPVAMIIVVTTDSLEEGDSMSQARKGKLKLNILDSGKATATLQLVDTAGIVVPLPAGATLNVPWSSSDPGIVVTPAPDTFSAGLAPATPAVLVSGAVVTAGPATINMADGSTISLPAVQTEALNVVAGGPAGFKIAVA